MRFSTSLLAGTSLLAINTFALAQQEFAVPPGTILLEPIVITALRTPQEAEKSGRAYTVITGEELDKSQVRYVADALRMVPGLTVSRTGSFGGLTQLRVRGAEGNHVLVMIDGIEASETSGGEFDFGSLLVDEVERIEILRGPQSAFWGSNATAGVVNIVTKKGQRDGVTVRGRSEVGSDGTWLGGGSISGGGPTYDLALSALHRSTGGFNVSDLGSEKDGDVNTTLNGKFTVDLTPVLSIDGTLRFVKRRSDFDDQPYPDYIVLDTDDQTATREFFGSFGATYTAFGGALVHKARLTGSDVFREYFAGGTQTSNNKGNRVNGLYQASYSFDTAGSFGIRNVITAGYEWEKETFLPSHLTDRLSRSTHSLVAEYRGAFAEQFFFNAAIRQDFNDAFENAATYSLGSAWRIPGTRARLHASVGNGITNPTFFEQFGYVPGQFLPNPNLIPERSFGWDIGIEQRFLDNRLTLDVTYFNQDLTNEIATDYSGPLPTPFNRDGISKRQGVEVAATFDFLNGFTTTASYTYTDSTDQTVEGGPRTREIRRPRHAGSLTAAYSFLDNRARLFGELIVNADMLDTDFATFSPVRLGDYAVFNLGGSYRFSEHLEGFARIENLFDEKYEEVLGFNTQGRTAFTGLKAKF